MSIEEIIEMLKDCQRLSNSAEEAERLEKNFIANFKKEYDILEKK